MTIAALVVLGLVMAAAGAWLGVQRPLPPGGYVIFGVVAALVLVGLAKALAALGLQRRAARERDDD
jgi:hypothetical protein